MNNLWVRTDDTTGQHVQVIAEEPGTYRFIDTIGLGESQYTVITDEARRRVKRELDLEDARIRHAAESATGQPASADPEAAEAVA